MTDKKNRGTRKSSDANPSTNVTRGRGTPAKSGEGRFEGYDQQRDSFDPSHQSNYDVDENDIDQRAGEYKNQGGDSDEDGNR